MRRFLFAASMGLLTVLMLASPALAARSWCARDPIVALDGAPVQIWVAIPDEYVEMVNGPIDVKIITPLKTRQDVIYLDPEGFNGHGEVLKFGTNDMLKKDKDGSFDALVSVTVPVDRMMLEKKHHVRSIPLQVTIETDGRLVTYEQNSQVVYDVVDGTVATIEQTNDGTKIQFHVTPDTQKRGGGR